MPLILFIRITFRFELLWGKTKAFPILSHEAKSARGANFTMVIDVLSDADYGSWILFERQ